MEKLMIDTGIMELEINDSGVLCFNASDPNVYKRFYDLLRELPELERRYHVEAETGDKLEQAGAALTAMRDIDAEVKRRLSEAFGPKNDFDALLDGVNLMAYGRNGERVVTNLLAALEPYMKRGMSAHMKSAADRAVKAAEEARAARGGPA